MSGSSDKDLTERRRVIDALDLQLLKLLSDRAAQAQAIGQIKGHAAAYRPEREAAVLRNVTGANRGPLSNEALARVYIEIMSACRALEQDLTVAYLGPQGTFSEMALTKHFGGSTCGAPCASIDEVFRAAETGAAGYAIVPVENSSEGAIGHTLDLLLASPLKVCAEVVLRVHQNLMAKATLDKITRVYSHAQSLAQCNQWLSQHLPRAEKIPVASNAEAARLAALESAAAAIGPAVAAAHYELSVLAENIEDEQNNMTRFFVLGAQDTEPTGRDHTALVMSAPNQPGAVHALLTPLAKHGVSMSRIESRPSRTGQWEYYFYIDLEGHQKEAKVERAIAELRALAPFLKVFGSYPTAVY